jgi:hypothetical protein
MDSVNTGYAVLLDASVSACINLTDVLNQVMLALLVLEAICLCGGWVAGC